MLKEIRFRDTLACEANRNFLKNLIQRGFEKFDGLEFDLDGFRILAREFPLIRDKVGYQLRFIDILGTNHHNDLLIIELKARYTKRRNIEKIEDQVNEYQELLKENIRDLRNQENFLSIFHFYQKEILNFMHFDYGKYRNIYKLIIFMRKTAPFDISKLNEVPIALTEKKTINTITKKYVNYEIRRVEDINPGFKQLLGQACFSKSIKNPKYRPLPLTIEDKKEKPYFRFESLSKSEFHKKYIQKDKIKNLQNLPKLYFDYDKRVTREDIFNKLNNGRFTIQLFNSGRSFPVFYLEYAPDKYIPFQQ
ncbi:MAG: hypothetical protein ACOC35_09565 [Promethearchaeia archaeon]